ncbi:phosphoribosylanthranilate isomerase [Sphingobium sufflavum]|uniref:phosphoribosylanthranilate isomerase n=1 Tax=Sphingobium sufflavum TaxID=1129547 RepID=UPI001F3CE537|nr:phosphoribosylanthranilate isomerase [Sphingobium sufflavum]MCE7797029.1 phosphoribosylanthranilate isomerase [Sphingobium sufflavum]
MSRLGIKICGLSTTDTLHAALKHGASHVGLMHFPKSPRHLELEALHGLATQIPAHVGRVVVMVDPDDTLVSAITAPGVVSALQLHGKESPQRVAEIAARTGLEIWKVISVKRADDIASAAAYTGAAHRILFDAKTPEGSALPGGMGVRFDWGLLAGYHGALPWALSGGLDAANVAAAIAQTGVPLVDVSSGVESAPGIKDVDKIAAFCKAVNAS